MVNNMVDPTSNRTTRSSGSFKQMIEATKTPFIFNAPEEGTGEEVFNNNFKPDVIFHRGNEIKSLAKYFNPLVKRTPSSKKPLMAILSGSVGSGKSLVVEALIKSLGEILRPKPRIGDPTLKIIKVNCRLKKDLRSVLATILFQMNPQFTPQRRSQAQLIEILKSDIAEHNLVLLLIIEDIEQLTLQERIQLMKIKASIINRLNLLFVTSDESTAHELSTSITSSYMSKHIHLSAYKPGELFEIVKDRASVGLKNQSYTDPILETIVELTAAQGDTRETIDLLWRTAKQAEKEQAQILKLDHVEKVFESQLPSQQPKFEILKHLVYHQQLLYFSLIDTIHTTDKPVLTTTEVKEAYYTLCDRLGIMPRRKTAVHTYITNLEERGLLQQYKTEKEAIMIKVHYLLIESIHKKLSSILRLGK